MKHILTALLLSSFFSSCSFPTSPKNYLESGTILVSKSVENYLNVASLQNSTSNEMNNLVGFFPPSKDFTPAFNELWLEVNTKNETISVKNGSETVNKFDTYGAKFAKKGSFFITSKNTAPKWQAPNSYFNSRGLAVPQDTNRVGAYGKTAIFATENLVIHTSPFWTSEVGGIKVSEKKLSKVFASLPVGSPIIIK